MNHESIGSKSVESNADAISKATEKGKEHQPSKLDPKRQEHIASVEAEERSGADKALESLHNQPTASSFANPEDSKHAEIVVADAFKALEKANQTTEKEMKKNHMWSQFQSFGGEDIV